VSKCPFCFLPLSDDERVFACQSGLCPDEANLVQSRMLDSEVTGPPFVRFIKPPEAKRWSPPATARHDKCQGGPTAPACPHCRYVLPEKYHDAVSVCVAVAGARATGKSVFIGVLKKLIDQLMVEAGNTVSWPDSSSRERYEKHYEAPLYGGNERLAATVPLSDVGSHVREPLVLSLGNVRGRLAYLAIRDTPGEELERGATRPLYQCFEYADLVLFLYDPLAMRPVRDALRGLIPAQDDPTTANPVDVLSTVLRRIGEGDPLLAIVISKFDIFQFLRSFPEHELGKVALNRGAGFMRASSSGGLYDKEHIALIHEETRSLMMMMGAQQIVTAVENPHRHKPYRHRFLVNSALGAPTEGNSISDWGIAPYRGDDAIRWALAEAGILR
jgi:hypothetical protein